MEQRNDSGFSRRSLVKGAAWAVPVVATAAAAPAAAVTIVKDPGINGWVSTSTQGGGFFNPCNKTVTVDSVGSGGTPDGAPFGLYIYDVNVSPNPDVITNAEMIYWIPSNITGTPSWTTFGSHSSCWSGPTNIGTETKPDGFDYIGYKWTYTCPIDPSDAVTGTDGEVRLFLGDFRVRGSYRLDGNCGTYNYWAQRRVTINGEVNCFQRRAGTGPSIGTTPCGPSARVAVNEQKSSTTETQVEVEGTGKEEWVLEHEGAL